jgi:hypothetical protein
MWRSRSPYPRALDGRADVLSRVTRTGVALILLFVTCGLPAAGQTTRPPDEIETDSDPTRPVFVSVRPEFYNADRQHRQLLIGRYDTAFRRRVIVRLEVPVVRTDDGQRAISGLGDAYGQFLLVPYASGRFAMVVGSGFILPTAVDSRLGGGKWVLAPVTAPLWRFSRGLFYVKLQNFTSVAGDEARQPVNYLLVTPTFIRAVGGAWWLLADAETKTNWREDGRTGVKTGVQIGRRIATGVGLWAKPEVWLGPHREGTWNLKVGVVWYQRRAARP